MKIKRFLQGLAAFAIIELFAGCTNILDSKTSEKSKENTSVSINFNANGRYISAGSFELNRITSWKVTFEPKGDSGEKDIELTWSSETSDSSSNSSSPSLHYSECVLNAKLIPTGIYDITLEGSYSEGNSIVTVSGTKEDVTVSSETAKNNITVIVGLKKDSSVNGSLELSFNTTSISNYAYALLVTLKNIQTGDIKYSTEKKNLDFGASADGSLYILTGENIAPGWYKLEFYHSDSVKIEIPGDKMMVEIASGIKTTDSDIKLSGTSVKRYYATNDNSESDQKMNGLSVSSRKNLTALLETLTENWPDVLEVDIFMDKVPEIDIKTFNELKKTLGNSKNLSIYSGESTSPIITANSSDTNAVNTVLSGSAWLVATDGNKNFEITNLSVGQDQVNSIDITLKNGACLDVTGEMSFSGRNIYAIKDSEDGTIQDNFASYIATPFFSSFSNTDVNSFSLRECASKNVSVHNTIISVSKEAEGDSCEFYIKPASMEGITAEPSDNLSIEAYYSSDSDKKVYVSGSAIPYESSSLEIKLNYPEGIEIKNCLWYLNGESFDDSGSELTGFDPKQASSLNVDGKNVISCFASVGEKLYLCEFNFTFKTPSRSAAVWFSGEGNNYSMKQIYDYTDSAATESIIKENLTSDSKYYCFDKNYNLWTAISGDALTLNKYSMKVSTDSYSTDPDLTKQLSEITSLSDMCYDCVNSYIYLLVSGDASVDVYAVSTGSKPAIVARAQIKNAGTFTNIAVNGNDFYFADSSCNVYKATGTVTSDSIAIGTPTFVKELATSAILEGHDSSKYDGTYDSISITDLQFGDGLEYGTENVYALVKETSDGLGFTTTHPDYFYSRGALVQINTTDDSINNISGWTSAQTPLTYYGNSCTDYYYIPDATDSSNTAFFGPEKFCAVVPKKIVIVDDGFYWKAGDSGDGVIKNKDSIVEFDIAGSTLTRGSASISASFNIGATDYYSGKVEN